MIVAALVICSVLNFIFLLIGYYLGSIRNRSE